MLFINPGRVKSCNTFLIIFSGGTISYQGWTAPANWSYFYDIKA